MGKFKDLSTLEAKWLIEDQAGADGKKEKKYIVEMTLLKEGWGNQQYGNYYQKKAVETVVPLSMARKKMFISHPTFAAGEVKPVERSITEWAATIQEAWVDTGFPDGKARARAKVKIHHPYLRQLAEEAPDELVCSIEGRGSAQPGKIEGKQCNVVEEVKWINAFNWVDYGGNADMGINMIEKKLEVEDMDIQTLEQLKIQLPGLVGELEKEISDKVKKDASEKSVIEDLKRQLTVRDKVVLDNERIISMKEKEIDELKVKENLRIEEERKLKESGEVKTTVDAVLTEAKLPEVLVSEFWKNRLYSLRPYKKDDGTEVTLAEQLKIEIDDRRLLASGDGGPAPVKNMGGEKDITVPAKEMDSRSKMWEDIFPNLEKKNGDGDDNSDKGKGKGKGKE